MYVEGMETCELRGIEGGLGDRAHRVQALSLVPACIMDRRGHLQPAPSGSGSAPSLLRCTVRADREQRELLSRRHVDL
jgi:hypothetical protein